MHVFRLSGPASFCDRVMCGCKVGKTVTAPFVGVGSSFGMCVQRQPRMTSTRGYMVTSDVKMMMPT
jgi:hypothetical protein